MCDRFPLSDATHYEHEVRLNRYVDGELAPDEQAVLFRHLAGCDACREELEAVLVFRRMSRQETMTLSPAAEEAFFERLDAVRGSAERVDRAEEHRSFWHQRTPLTMRTLVLTALLLFVAGSMTPLGQQRGGRQLASVVRPEAGVQPPMEVIYVFYPGLTIEADPPEEPGTEDAL